MPIEVFPGKTGPRLITRDVRDGSYASITCEGGGGAYAFRATYQGGWSGGYPALSPLLETVGQNIAQLIASQRSMLEHNIRRYLNSERFPHKEYPNTRRVAREELQELERIVPILTSIKVGTPLRIVLPDPFPTKRYLLGTVLGWDIFNA